MEREYNAIVVGSAVKVKHVGGTFIGICIRKDKKSRSLKLRNVVNGFGIEYKFNINSSIINSLEVLPGSARKTSRKCLYYLRTRRMKQVKDNRKVR